MQRHDERICPLAREIGGEGGVGVWSREEGQDKPILPLRLVLELRGLLEEKLLRLVIAAILKYSKKNRAHTSIKATRSGLGAFAFSYEHNNNYFHHLTQQVVSYRFIRKQKNPKYTRRSSQTHLIQPSF